MLRISFFCYNIHLSQKNMTQLDKAVVVNLLTPMRLSSLFAPDMILRQKGHIVNISSLAGWCCKYLLKICPFIPN
jgi:short-subunit dehydrogenase